MTESDELDRLLAAWATRYRLTQVQVASVRAHVASSESAAPAALDAEWLWSLLRPVTALYERLDREPADAPAGWPTSLGQHWTTYLQLA